MTPELVLRAVLGILAVYHVGMGVTAFASPRTAARLAGWLYALDAQETPALRYGVRMLGLYALGLGALLAVATANPAGNVEIAAVVAGLQLARAAARLAFRHELAAAFHVPPRRNALNAAVLVLEAAVIAAMLLLL